jgi:hypothetical protein
MPRVFRYRRHGLARSARKSDVQGGTRQPPEKNASWRAATSVLGCFDPIANHQFHLDLAFKPNPGSLGFAYLVHNSPLILERVPDRG